MTLFRSNGRAPSLNQVVQLARLHVTERSRQRARQIDEDVFNPKPTRDKGRNLGKTAGRINKVTKSKGQSRYEKINSKYESKFYSYDN